MVNVGKYIYRTIHGDYGYDLLLEVPGTSSSTRLHKKERVDPRLLFVADSLQIPTSTFISQGEDDPRYTTESKGMVQSSASPKLGCTSPFILLMATRNPANSPVDMINIPILRKKHDFDSSHKVLLMES